MYFYNVFAIGGLAFDGPEPESIVSFSGDLLISISVQEGCPLPFLTCFV